MKILVATDGSSASREAEWFLCRVPFPKPVEVDLATVVAVPALETMRREFPATVGELIDEYHASAEALLAAEATRFEGIDGDVRTHVLSGHPAEEIVQAAADLGSELVVVGARGHTATQRLLLGSVSFKVAKHSPCSVLVLRASDSIHDELRPLRIVVAHDGSASSQSAIRMLASITWGPQVEITVVSVVVMLMHFGMEIYQKSQELWREHQRQTEEALDWAMRELRQSTPNVTAKLCQGENAAEGIVGVVEDLNADIIVLGERGRSRIERFLLGSTSHAVLAHAPCSVWIVREARPGSRSVSGEK